MRRLYVLVPTADHCRGIVAELEASGIPASHLHAIAGLGHDLVGLPAASIWQRTELGHCIEWGIGLGSTAGFIGGLLAVAFPPGGLVLALDGGALLVCTAAGAGFGAIVTSLIGSREQNCKLGAYRRALARGNILVLVDVPRHRGSEVRESILRRCADAKIASVKKPKANAEARRRTPAWLHTLSNLLSNRYLRRAIQK